METRYAAEHPVMHTSTLCHFHKIILWNIFVKLYERVFMHSDVFYSVLFYKVKKLKKSQPID